MKIQARLLLLLVCLLAGFGTAVWLLRNAHHREAAMMLSDLQEEREGLLDRLLVLTGQSLHSFSTDYALWDEMVDFVRTRDLAWAKINIDASLPNFGAQAGWVLQSDGQPVYRSNWLEGVDPSQILPTTPDFVDQLTRGKTSHFFLESPAGLLEVRAAPIQPSDDIQHRSAAQGWWMVARLWDEAYLNSLAEAMQGAVLLDDGNPPPPSPYLIRMQRDLPDWRGQTLRSLRVDYQPIALTRLLASNKEETYLLYGFGLAIIVAVVVGISRWVVHPLRYLGASMESGEPGSLGLLPEKQNEFGHLARLMKQFFAQRDALRSEVEEHLKTELSLRQTEASLRQSLDLRSRLARDLHDGIIQPIYAAGLGLEGVRSLLQTDPARANQQLAACQQALNNTLREVRSFIIGLEPESAEPQSFAQAVTTLARTMETIQPVKITLALDQAVALRLSPEQELQALQIIRESISNVLRHAEATNIRLVLQSAPDGTALLEITDDGCGFDPAQRTGAGRGLVNIATRARDMAGTLHLDSAPGKGTRVSFSFQPVLFT